MSNNQVTLYSNGIGHFRRMYPVEAGRQTKISIPFNQTDIGDVLASVQVFGNVKYDAPPSFTPTNASETSLNINPCQSFESLLQALVGAKVTIRNGETVFTLLGTDVSYGENNQKTTYVILNHQGTISRSPLENLSLTFVEESVQSEIDKALSSHFRKIKPNSTFLDIPLSSLDLDGEGRDEQAEVQYTIPVAAWKMRYSIRQEGDKFLLEGAAIIDNNTDEDWKDFIVSVVTGDPISFATDLAQIVTPTRDFISLVDGASPSVLRDNAVVACSYGTKNIRPTSGRNFTRSASNGNYAEFGMEELSDTGGLEAAAAPGMESRDVGDFCVFTAKELISIASRRSAVVPMFTVTLTLAGDVLLYKSSSNGRRPYRAVKFRNETDYSLGKGKVTIYRDGTLQGECVLEATKPGENRMLPHCIENGVKIVKDEKSVETNQTSIIISDGLIVDQKSSKAATVYTIENRKDEEFRFLLEHTERMPKSKSEICGEGLVETEKLLDGVRGYFTLPPKGKLTVTVVDNTLTSHRVSLKHMYSWISENIFESNNPLSEDKGLVKCLGIQKKIEKVDEEVSKLNESKNHLMVQIKRIQENLKAVKEDVGLTARETWVNDLVAAEAEIRKTEKETLPNLSVKQKDLQKDLRKALKEIATSWSAS